MNHLNKQIEVNHSALEQYLTEQDRKDRVQKRLDRVGLGLMIFLGLIGLLYCFSNANSIFKKSSKAQSQFLEEGNYQYAIAGLGKANSPAKLGTKKLSSAFVNIEGTPKAGERLSFLLDDYNAEASYEFSLGNGDHQQINDQHLAYTYDTPGTYEVTLQVTYQGETKTAYAKILTIN